MNPLKKYVSMMLCALFVIGGAVSVQAGPPNPWKLSEAFDKAVAAGDPAAVISVGKQVIDYYKDIPDTDKTKLDVLAVKYSKMALAYEKTYQWEEASNAWKTFARFAANQGWSDSVREGEYRARIIDYTKLQVFITQPAKSLVRPYSGRGRAKFEPLYGLYYGKPIGTYEQFQPDKQSSIISSYAIYSRDKFLYPDNMQDKILLLNWNIPDDNYGIIKDIPNQTAYITAFAKEFNTYGQPILLRFAGEMNVWEPRPNPAEYKSAFITVAKIMKSVAPNVAMVWSPSDIPPFNVKTSDYYPGDEYVDWVGLSVYTSYDFLGNESVNDFTDATFMAGIYADPLARISETVELYGDKKPIIITETGIEHTAVALKKDRADWAVKKLEEFYYYLPVLFPQVEAVVHFDVRMKDAKLWYDLSGVPKLRDAYNKVTKSNSYLSSAFNFDADSMVSYEKMTSRNVAGLNSVEVTAFAALPQVKEPVVYFTMDGVFLHKAANMPYKLSIDLTKYKPGEHKLEIKLFDGSRLVDSKTYTLAK